VAQAILTTDLVEKTVSKQFRVNGKTVAISGIAKGSGMIRPNMATMLSFIFNLVAPSPSLIILCAKACVTSLSAC
jgi:glutamate N-acetyltransferase/amino-acid N-acetyltransferase